MKKIRTVTGDIEQGELGWCQCHEHIFVADGPSRRINDALWMDDYDKSLQEVLLYKEAGGQSLVDAQPYRCGRMGESLLRVSAQTGVHIIACTGFHKTEFFEDLDWLNRQTEDMLARIFIDEVEKGMDAGKVPAKAGIIKCAAVHGEEIANSTYAKLFSAAANAARVSGAPVLVHFDPGADAFRIIRFFEQNGVQANRLILCHLDRARFDKKYHQELAQAGVYLEYDTIHREKYHSDEDEAALIEMMVSEGYAHNLLLGLDTTRYRLKSYGAAFGLDDILIRFRNTLNKRIGREILDMIMKDNPSRALSLDQ